jgi:hypothetical protein
LGYFSNIESRAAGLVDGAEVHEYRSLLKGEVVDLEWEAHGHDGFDNRAVTVRRRAEPPRWKHETTGRASNESEALRLADDLLEFVERIGMSDFLAADGFRPGRLLAWT